MSMRKLGAVNAPWYKKPEMMGHIWAKETVDALSGIIQKYGKSPKQQYLVQHALDIGNKDWHYFVNSLSKSELGRIKHVLKHVDKAPAADVHSWYSRRAGMLRSNMDRALNVMAYQENPNSYLTRAAADYKFYGMDDKAARERALRLVQSFAEKLHGEPSKKGGPVKVKASRGRKAYTRSKPKRR